MKSTWVHQGKIIFVSFVRKVLLIGTDLRELKMIKNLGKD